MSVDARIAETFTLPSRGRIYEETVNPNFVMGSMKTKHEMMRLSATTNGNKIMADIIDDCIVDDIGISSYDMCLGDFQYLLYKLRTVTFGPEYDMGGLCPHCGSENYLTVNLDELIIDEFTPDIMDKLIVDLPESKTEVTLTLQTPRMLDKITRMVQDRKRRVKKASDNPMLLYTITTSIEKIDGRDIGMGEDEYNPLTLEEWVRELPMGDTNILLNRIREINSMIGVQTSVSDICTTCGRAYDAPFQINGTFFRPNN